MSRYTHNCTLLNLHNYWKSPYLIGQLTITGPCSIAMLKLPERNTYICRHVLISLSHPASWLCTFSGVARTLDSGWHDYRRVSMQGSYWVSMHLDKTRHKIWRYYLRYLKIPMFVGFDLTIMIYLNTSDIYRFVLVPRQTQMKFHNEGFPRSLSLFINPMRYSYVYS